MYKKPETRSAKLGDKENKEDDDAMDTSTNDADVDGEATKEVCTITIIIHS